jgi:hypothetical protein
VAATAATQLTIPGALVSVSSPDVGVPVNDQSVWQRAVLRASLSSAAKLVALALASHTTPADNGHATCAPGLATLVTETGYSRTHVQRQISTLRVRGWLVAVGRPSSGRPARFVLSMPDAVARTHGVAAQAQAQALAPAPAPASAGATSAPSPRRGRGRPAGVVTGRPSAAARRRARITAPAMAKSLTAAADDSGLENPPAVSGYRSPAAAAAAGVAPSQRQPSEPSEPTELSQPSQPSLSPLRQAQEPPPPVLAGSVGAAWQILATLARAMRCGPEDFGDAADRLTAVLDSGSWSPAALATHLVDFVVGGVMVAGADPVHSLGWRLDRLPASDRDCACRSCRSWQQRPAAPAAPTSPPVQPASLPAPRAAAASPAPELAAIEQAAAAGAAQARMRATGAA